MASNLFRDFKDAIRHSGQRNAYYPPRFNKPTTQDAKSSRCAKPGCKGTAILAARGRLALGNVDASPYCNEHACGHWDGPRVCKTPTARGEGFCDMHKKCNDPRCSNCQKVMGKKRSPYCADHACAKSGCKEVRYLKNSNLNAKYCDKHTCSDKDCLEKAGDGGRCEAIHTCAKHTCTEPVSSPANPADAHPSDRYCIKHKICRISGCGQEIKILDHKPKRHCADHHCTYGHDCDDPRVPGGGGPCAAHTCSVLNCNGVKSALPGAQYCKDGDEGHPPHECKEAGCAERRWHLLNSEYCIYHICADYSKHSCANKGDPQKNRFCDKHERCAEVGCEKPRFVDGLGDRQRKCEEHMSPCGATGCGKPRYLGGRHCRDHTCAASNDCSGVRYPGSLYCIGHKCVVPSCQGQRRFDGSGIPLQLLLAINPSGSSLGSLGLTPFCDRHGCARPGCDDKMHEDGKFCATHTCRSRGCTTERLDKRDFCAAHVCQSRNCMSEIVENGQHCVQHTCTARDCTNEAQTKGRYHGRCRYHEEGSDSDSDSSDDNWGAWPGWDLGDGGRGGRRPPSRPRRGRQGLSVGGGGGAAPGRVASI